MILKEINDLNFANTFNKYNVSNNLLDDKLNDMDREEIYCLVLSICNIEINIEKHISKMLEKIKFDELRFMFIRYGYKLMRDSDKLEFIKSKKIEEDALLLKEIKDNENKESYFRDDLLNRVFRYDSL